MSETKLYDDTYKFMKRILQGTNIEVDMYIQNKDSFVKEVIELYKDRTRWKDEDGSFRVVRNAIFRAALDTDWYNLFDSEETNLNALMAMMMVSFNVSKEVEMKRESGLVPEPDENDLAYLPKQ